MKIGFTLCACDLGQTQMDTNYLQLHDDEQPFCSVSSKSHEEEKYFCSPPPFEKEKSCSASGGTRNHRRKLTQHQDEFCKSHSLCPLLLINRICHCQTAPVSQKMGRRRRDGTPLQIFQGRPWTRQEAAGSCPGGQETYYEASSGLSQRMVEKLVITMGRSRS